MEIITGYTGKPHVTSEQDRDVNIGVVGEGSYVLRTECSWQQRYLPTMKLKSETVC